MHAFWLGPILVSVLFLSACGTPYGTSNVAESIGAAPKATVVTVEGEVQHPGVYAFAEGVSLARLIAQAGGVTDFAWYATIDRAGTEQRIGRNQFRSLDSEDIRLQAGDRILVHFIE